MCPAQKLLSHVEQLRFGPESDNFCQALRIALQAMGEDIDYSMVSTWSGRAFSTCFDTQLFYWDRHLTAPDPDAEGYLRGDYASVQAAVERLGYDPDLLACAQSLHPEQPEVVTGARMKVADAEILHTALCAEIDAGRPCLALFSLSTEHWAPEWTLFTGYADDGATVIGWSCFQHAEGDHMAGVETEEAGQFRLSRWASHTPCLVRLSGEAPAARDLPTLERSAIEDAVAQSRGRQQGRQQDGRSWGLAAFDAWATAIEDPDNNSLDEGVLRGRMQYHRHLVGHLAAQKWYSSVGLRRGEHSPWTTADVLRAAAAYASFHEVMWEIWDVAGAYWRDEQQELGKFQEAAARAQIASLIRQAGELDAEATGHLETALGRWDKSHAHYLDH